MADLVVHCKNKKPLETAATCTVSLHKRRGNMPTVPYAANKDKNDNENRLNGKSDVTLNSQARTIPVCR
jgi:hypothetical protein